MNLGDGLLFELENGKPKLILLSRGVERKPAKLSFRPRAANVLSSRQPSCAEEAQGEERPARQQQAGRHRETKSKAGGAAASFTSNTSSGGRSITLTSSKTPEHLKGPGVKVVAKVKSDRLKHGTAVGSQRADGKTGRPQNSGARDAGREGPPGPLAGGDAGPKEGVACLTNQQLQRILHTVQTSSLGPHPPEDHQTQVNQTDSKEAGSSTNRDGGRRETKEEDRGGGGESQDKDNRPSGCPFSWLEERQSDSRAAIDAKKALWRRELDEQVVLKQQRSAPSRLQAEEDTESVFSVQSSFSHRGQHAAIRSSLRLGEVTPMEEELSVERREAQRRRWLEELDLQREETSERRRRERLLQSQTEDHELWATHFDSMQRPPVQTAAPSAASLVSERGDWEPSSSLSLVWEAESVGGASVGGASIDTTSGYPTRASYLRTMTALLDPAQIEERERRRLKQLEHQRAIEAQVEERRLQRKREEAMRREELEEEERKVALEREMLERQYKLDRLRERQKSSSQAEQLKAEQLKAEQLKAEQLKAEQLKAEQLKAEQLKAEQLKAEQLNAEQPKAEQPKAEQLKVEQPKAEQPKALHDDHGRRRQETLETSAPSLPLRVQTPDLSAQFQPPPLLSAAPNIRKRSGKENICLQAGGGGGGADGGGADGGGEDPYEAFARTDRSRRDRKRPEWNTQRPTHRFVPASQRYPAPLQRNRQESRQRRQAELLALQERTCVSRTEPPPPLPPPPPPHPQHQEPRLGSNPTQTRTSPTSRVENVSRGPVLAAVYTDRGRSPPNPTGRQRVQSQAAPSSSAPPPLPPPAPLPPALPLEFIPYVRTDEVFNMDPLESADTPPPHTHTDAPPSHRLLHSELLHNTKTHRQQEILRGLAQLRQGLLQKQRELEMDLNPLLKHHDNEHWPPAAMQRK